MKSMSPFTYVMRLTLCKIQKDLNLNNADMASRLGLTERQLKRLRTGQQTIRTGALKKFEILLQEEGW